MFSTPIGKAPDASRAEEISGSSDRERQHFPFTSSAQLYHLFEIVSEISCIKSTIADFCHDCAPYAPSNTMPAQETAESDPAAASDLSA